MTRITKAERERQEQGARIRAALRWTKPAPGPDVPPPDGFGLSTGYLFNAYTNRVDVACSGAVSHAFGRG